MMKSQKTQPVQLYNTQLSFYCPNSSTPIWSSHPRVFLMFDNCKTAKCPYCGTIYQLQNSMK